MVGWLNFFPTRYALQTPQKLTPVVSFFFLIETKECVPDVSQSQAGGSAEGLCQTEALLREVRERGGADHEEYVGFGNIVVLVVVCLSTYPSVCLFVCAFLPVCLAGLLAVWLTVSISLCFCMYETDMQTYKETSSIRNY